MYQSSVINMKKKSSYIHYFNQKLDNVSFNFKNVFVLSSGMNAICKSVGELSSKSVGKLSSNLTVNRLQTRKTRVGELSCRPLNTHRILCCIVWSTCEKDRKTQVQIISDGTI